MRIVQIADLPVLVRITRNGETLVAVPDHLSTVDILALASVVLTDDEFSELRQQLVVGADQSA